MVRGGVGIRAVDLAAGEGVFLHGMAKFGLCSGTDGNVHGGSDDGHT